MFIVVAGRVALSRRLCGASLNPSSAGGHRVAMVGVLAGISAHPVWVGYMLSLIVGYQLKLIFTAEDKGRRPRESE